MSDNSRVTGETIGSNQTRVRKSIARFGRRAKKKLRHRATMALWRSRAALQHWSGADNPFLRRAWHVETRAGRAMKLALLFSLWMLAGVFGVWLLWSNLDPQSAADFWGNSRLPSHLPAFLGDNFVGFAALVAAEIVAFGALLMSRWRISAMLRREQLQGTLEQLQLLPLSPERWLWLTGAPGVLLALFLALLGAPLFALALFTSQWSLLDLCGLLLVFLWLGHAAPASLVASAAARDETASPTLSAIGSAIDNEVKEIQKLTRSETQAPPAATSSTRNATTTTKQPVRTPRGAQADAVTSWIFLGLLIQFALWVVRFWVTTSGVSLVSLGWPERIVELMPGLPLTWPLVLARLVSTPLPFFALWLPPIVLLAPWIVGRQRCAYLRLANSVDTVIGAQRVRRDVRAAKLRRPLGWLLGAMLLGFGWRPLVIWAIPALLRGAPTLAPTTNALPPTVPAWTQAALWTAILLIVTLRAWNEIARAFRLEVKAASSTRSAAIGRWKDALRSVARNIAGAFVLYGVLCALGGLSGFDALWRARFWPTTATALAFLVAVCGMEAIGAALPATPPRARTRWRVVGVLWFYGLALEVVVRQLVTQTDMNAPYGHFEFVQAPHVLFGPLVSLFSLLRFQLTFPVGFAWWSAPLFQAVVGLLCAAISVPLARRRAQNASSLNWWQRFWRFFWKCVETVARGVWFALAFVFKPFARLLVFCAVKTLGGLYSFVARNVNALIDWGEALRNPVLDFALRRGLKSGVSTTKTTPQKAEEKPVKSRARRTQALRQSLTVICFFCLCLETVAFGVAVVSNGPLLFSPWTTSRDWQTFGVGVASAALVLATLVVLIATSNVGNALDVERKNGTLVFLFLTPLSDEEILRGKLLFSVLATLPVLTTTLPWLLLGIVIATLGGAWAAMPLGVLWLGAVMSFAAFCWSRQIGGAASATKVGTGASTAVSRILLVEVLLIGALSFLVVNGWLWIAPALLLASAFHLAAARVSWRNALRALNRQRYNDAATRGTVAN